jgi:hypothetical protein
VAEPPTSDPRTAAMALTIVLSIAYTLYAPPMAARLSKIAAKQLFRDRRLVVSAIGCPKRLIDAVVT